MVAWNGTEYAIAWTYGGALDSSYDLLFNRFGANGSPVGLDLVLFHQHGATGLAWTSGAYVMATTKAFDPPRNTVFLSRILADGSVRSEPASFRRRPSRHCRKPSERTAADL